MVSFHEDYNRDAKISGDVSICGRQFAGAASLIEVVKVMSSFLETY